MNIAICDDMRRDAEEIRRYLLAYFEKNGFAGDIHMYFSGETLLDDFESGSFDVLFLDIYMDGISGVDAARHIRGLDPNCLIVFITISDSHMREGFAVRAASYVEKPITAEKIEVAFTQCHKLFLKNARFIEITSASRSFKLPFSKMIYAENKGRSVFFHTDAGDVYEAHMKMDEAERQMEGLPALRCHQSFVVNMNYVSDMRGNDIFMKNGQSVPVRKNGRKDVALALNDFLTRRLFETE